MSPSFVIGLSVAALLVLAALVCECAARLWRFRLAPVRLRLLYASFLLNAEAVNALAEIHQRAERAGCTSFRELFELYAAAAGCSVNEIEARFGLNLPYRRLLRSNFVLRNYLQWHLGVVPVPGQQLRTVTIEESGVRRTAGSERSDRRIAQKKRVMVVGGSAAYGYGATSDEATIPSRLEHWLNALEQRPGVRWEVSNFAFPGATSFQELLTVLQRCGSDRGPDYVVSLTGWNDVDDQFNGAAPRVSGLAQNYTRALEQRSVVATAALDFGGVLRLRASSCAFSRPIVPGRAAPRPRGCTGVPRSRQARAATILISTRCGNGCAARVRDDRF